MSVTRYIKIDFNRTHNVTHIMCNVRSLLQHMEDVDTVTLQDPVDRTPEGPQWSQQGDPKPEFGKVVLVRCFIEGYGKAIYLEASRVRTSRGDICFHWIENSPSRSKLTNVTNWMEIR